MTTSSGTNYRELYFEFTDLTKVQGEPDSESLYRLRNELKANAQSVYSNLSDGLHGHLGLVLPPTQYALITNVPFVRPTHPGLLAIPPGTTAPMIAVMKDAHTEQLRLFKEVTGVEKALIQQMVRAIDPPYLAALRDRASNSLRGTVSQVLEHLNTVYGRVSPQMLENREQELRTMLYNAKFPIDMVFNAVEDFVDFTTLALQPITQKQTISKAYIIINKTGRFKQAITEWNRRPDVQKTWITFKDHFRQAHQEFRETTDVTLEESELQRNNAHLVQQVVDGIQSSIVTDESTITAESNAIIQQMANSAARSSETQQQLTAQLQQMQQTMAVLQAQVQQSHMPHHQPFTPRGGGRNFQGRGYRGGGHNNGGGGYNNGGYHNPRGRAQPYRPRTISSYCWTHGACAHASATCLTKHTGHQDAATFLDKMGGSTNHCPIA
jgi:hypothetical protein